MSKNHVILLYLTLTIKITTHELHYTQAEIRSAMNSQKIHYNSALRLQHLSTKYYLSSDEIRYSADSEKFPVTLSPENDNFSSLWILKSLKENTNKNYDDFLRCDDLVNFEHVVTNKNLHMDFTESMISKSLNVSNNLKNEEITEENDFLLSCVNQNSESIVNGNTEFRLKNLKTKGFLYSLRHYEYNNRNCGRRCPIMGHFEVSGLKYVNKDTKWKFHSGVLFQNDIDEEDKEDKWVYEPEEVFDKQEEL